MKKKLLSRVIIVMALFMFAGIGNFAQAATIEREYGTDTAIYQGANAQKVQGSDTFSIAQIGGSVHGRLYDQWTYRSQVSTGIAMGLRMHTYVWMDTGGNTQLFFA